MNVTFIILSVLLATTMLGPGVTKVLKRPQATEGAEHLGYSVSAFQAIGALEVAAAAGLVIGLFWTPLGIAAAAGLVLLLGGAVFSHRRVGDGPKLFLPALVLAVVAAATLIVGFTVL
ncbi:DoxX family protein [Streptomyces sp. ODS28]|uniref:DoxX family protein n=1 Tax=Streptomyces sp. ODS28 TaxID=3136688 RepID=UPI0031E80191